MKDSNFMSLNFRDFLKGLVIAVLTPVIFIIQQSLDEGQLVFDWKKIGIAAVSGFLAYLVKNFFTKPDVTKTVIIIFFCFLFSSCAVNYRLNRACNISANVLPSGGGKVAVCLVCDSISPRLFKAAVRKYGEANVDFYKHK